MDLLHWLRTYTLRVGNATVKLNTENQLQSDVLKRKLNGQCGAAEFVGEVAASSVARDSTTKLNLYQEFKVKEYLNWKTAERQVRWYHLVDDRYQQIVPVNGVLRSVEFDGLCLDVRALIEGNITQVINTLSSELEG